MKKFAVLLLAFSVFAQAFGGELFRTGQMPVIDGVMDKVWSNVPAKHLRVFRNWNAKPNIPTEFRAMYDDTCLYVFVHCFEPNMHEAKFVSQKYDRHDSPVHGNDCIELFVDNFQDGKRCYQFVLDVYGGMEDLLYGESRYRNAVEWSGFWISAVKENEKGWCAEIAIPWSTIGTAPGRNQQIGINFSRMRRASPAQRSVLVNDNALLAMGKFLKYDVKLQPLSVSGELGIGTIFTGNNTINVQLKNRSRAAVDGELIVVAQNDRHEQLWRSVRKVSLKPGAAQVKLQGNFASAGRVYLMAYFCTGGKTQILSAISSLCLPPFESNDPAPILFQGERRAIYVRVFADIPNQQMRVKILNSAGQEVASAVKNSARGAFFLDIPSAKLAPGSYRLILQGGKDRLESKLTIIRRP